MNVRRLKEAEAVFLARFPGGFGDPDPLMQRIRKSHNVDRLADFTRTHVTEAALSKPHAFAQTLLTIISRSSMVSRFEKPPFRALVEELGANDRRRLAEAFRKRLFGTAKRQGFDEIVDLLGHYKLARWSLVSAVPFYFAPSREAFVKPSTAKRIVAYLEVEGELRYTPRPEWRFYCGYRKLIRKIGRHVDSRLTPNNAATTGFLMATM